MESFWEKVDESTLRQGDYLLNCPVPLFRPDFTADHNTHDVLVNEFDLIVLTQSCDLENDKVRLVATSPICPISEFERQNPGFAKRGRWNEVLKGRIEGLHLLASPSNAEDNRQALVVDFREIYSLPFDYLTGRAAECGPRWRLRPPFLEHFSQTFARFFMRVGLPSTIPEFK